MRCDAAGAVCCLAALFCIAFALTGRIPAAVISLAACAACFAVAAKARRTSGGVVESDALQFIDNVLENYSDSVNTLTLLEKSLNDRFDFCKDMQSAIRTYVLSSDARQAFSVLLRYDSYALRGITSAVIGRLEEGTELRMQLAEVRKHALRRSGKELKNIGAMGSALSITQIGSVLFFPIFAGISLNIMQFTAGMQGAGHPSAPALIAVFAFYIAYLNLLNFKYNMKESTATRAEKAALSCATALLVFKAASVLSVGML
jgi:hypothetical protein